MTSDFTLGIWTFWYNKKTDAHFGVIVIQCDSLFTL